MYTEQLLKSTDTMLYVKMKCLFYKVRRKTPPIAGVLNEKSHSPKMV